MTGNGQTALKSLKLMSACESLKIPICPPDCRRVQKMVQGLCAPRYFRSWELPGTKFPGNIRSQERKLSGTFVHGSEVSHWEFSLRGAKIPGSEKSRYPQKIREVK